MNWIMWISLRIENRKLLRWFQIMKIKFRHKSWKQPKWRERKTIVRLDWFHCLACKTKQSSKRKENQIMCHQNIFWHKSVLLFLLYTWLCNVLFLTILRFPKCLYFIHFLKFLPSLYFLFCLGFCFVCTYYQGSKFLHQVKIIKHFLAET